MSQKERRKSPRVRAHRLVSFRRLEDRGTTDYEGFVRTLNLGLGGLLLETDYVFSFQDPEGRTGRTIKVGDLEQR